MKRVRLSHTQVALDMESESTCSKPNCKAGALCAAPELSRVLEGHAARLHAIAQRILGSSDLASDAVQETFIALWQAPELPQNLRGWLARAVLHRSLHAKRTEGRRRHWEQLAGESWAENCPICDPARDAESRELSRRLDSALGALSSDQRLAFELREFEGLEYGEIASLLKIPVGTVRSRLNRARRALRQEFLVH